MSEAENKMIEKKGTLVTTDPRRMPVQSMQDAITLATAFAQAHVMGAQNPAEGMLAVTLINEVGLVQAEASYHIMMGRLSKKAHAILADFIAAGGKYKIIQRDADAAEVEASFKQTKNARFRFAWEDALQEPFVYAGNPSAQQAELKKPIEERKLKNKYATPRSRMQMLWARLISDMGNALCPTAGGGMYPPEVVADFDELQSGKEVEVIDVDEVAQRVNAEPVNIVDPTICPVGDESVKGKKWGDLESGVLLFALESDLTQNYKTVINKVLKKRGDL